MIEITPDEFVNLLTAEGFVVEEDAQVDESFYYSVRHPDEEGIYIEVIVSDDEVENVERKVDGGLEGDLKHQYPTLDGLTKEQVDHLFTIDFGTYFPEIESFDTFDELLDLIKENIKVNPVL